MGNAMAPIARVTKRLAPSTKIVLPPLVVRPGDLVTVGERSEEWPAYLLVTDSRGSVSWVPERILHIDGTAGRVLVDYDTTSLDPSVGDELSVIAEDAEAGWLWCRDSSSRLGWFPKSHVTFEKE
jgi:hypothetical protein